MDFYYEVNGNGHPVVLLTSGAAVGNWTFIESLFSKTLQGRCFSWTWDREITVPFRRCQPC